MSRFSIKVFLARFTFVFILFGCWEFYRRGLTDYIILAAVIVAFVGIFSISAIEFRQKELFIKKNYFWGLFWFRLKLSYDQVISVGLKEYLIDRTDEVDSYEDIGLSLALYLNDSKARWFNTEIRYDDYGIEKNIELKISPKDYKNLEKLISLLPKTSSKI